MGYNPNQKNERGEVLMTTTTMQPQNFSKLSVWGFAIALLSSAFIMSSSYLVLVGLITPFISITLSVLGLKDIRKNNKRGKFYSIFGIIYSSALLAVVGGLMMWVSIWQASGGT